MRKLIFLVVLVALLSGCSPWIGIHKIEPGMSKAEVMQQMGKPNSASGSGNEEYLWYIPANLFWERYYVHIVNGKVEAYGQQSNETAQTEQ